VQASFTPNANSKVDQLKRAVADLIDLYEAIEGNGEAGHR
jgi:hypothetical protein